MRALCGPGELHCGGCGVNLAVAFQKKLEDLQARLEQAQQLRQSHEHDRAIELLKDGRRQVIRNLRHCVNRPSG